MKIIGKNTNKGFTLMEILIVIIILGVLAGLAVPMYQDTVEKARKAEALATLDAVRQAEMRYFALNREFIELDPNDPNGVNPLDFDPNDTAGGQTLHFEYEVTEANGNGFIARATRTTENGGDTTKTVTLNQAGEISDNF